MADDETPSVTEPDLTPITDESKEEGDSSSLIQRANEAAERLETANKELAVLIKKQEALQVEAKLGGKTTASISEKTEEQKAIAAAKKVIEGSGFEDIFPE